MEDELLTRQQMKSINLWCGQSAQVLNEEGKSVAMILQRFVLDTPATKYIFKELFWKPLMEATLGKKSTKELLKKKEIDLIVDSLTKFFGEEIQVSLPPFPSQEELSFKEEYSSNTTRASVERR